MLLATCLLGQSERPATARQAVRRREQISDMLLYRETGHVAHKLHMYGVKAHLTQKLAWAVPEKLLS